MIIKSDEVRGVVTDADVMLCLKCFNGTLEELTHDQIITEQQIESSEDLYFCDDCKRQL